MKLTRRELAKVLDAASRLTQPCILHLRDYLEGRAIDKRNPFALRVMYYFLVDIKEYTKGADKLRKRLATLVRKAGIDPEEYRPFGKTRLIAPTGGTPMAKKSKRSKKVEEEVEEEETDEESDDDEDMPDDTDDEDLEEDEEEEDDEDEDDSDDTEEDEEDEEEEEEEEEEPPKPKRRAKSKVKKSTKKGTAKKEEKPKKKAKKDRNESVASEDRVPILVEKMKKPGPSGESGWTLNELFHVLGQKKANAKLFPTRRSVKRTMVAYEGDQFTRSTPSLWELNEGKKKKKSKKGTEKKGKSKKDAKAKKGAEKKGTKKAKRKSKK